MTDHAAARIVLILPLSADNGTPHTLIVRRQNMHITPK